MINKDKITSPALHASDCSSSLDNIVSKWRIRCYNYDIVHTARSLYFHRYILSVETAGGSYSAGWFRTKKDALYCRRNEWTGRDFRVYDKWESVDLEMLDDMKTLVKLLKWRDYSSIHDAPLSFN